MSAHFAIGIDLGTTHSALAYASLDEDASGGAPIHTLQIPQTYTAFEVVDRPLLPSFLYRFAAPEEFGANALALPWREAPSDLIGEFARSRGAAVPTRLVSSAKSWLGHGEVDRREAFLPLEAPPEVAKISPVAASQAFIEHLRAAWDHAHPDAPFSDQQITLTVPASFDPAARELTVEAARSAGCENLTILEEPQAALYAFLADHRARFGEVLGVGDVLLVVDVGGGTTDLSLIAITEADGRLVPHRIAVGEHILLGGDNMDLALAALVERKLVADGHTLDDWQRRGLVHACRAAKESLYAVEDSLPEAAIVVPSRGSKLVGGSLRTSLTRAEVDAVLLDGFFPRVLVNTKPLNRARAGLLTLGLPYAQDAGITRHLAAFVSRHAYATKGLPGFEEVAAGARFLHPTAILFNGGVFASRAFAERVTSQITAWLEADGSKAARVVEGVDLNGAVARGAAYFGVVRREGGVRIRGGLAHSFYVGVEGSAPAIPGVEPPLHALCVAPFGLEEGAPAEPLPTPFGLVVGEPVSFRFFGSSSRRDDRVGASLNIATEHDLTELGAVSVTLSAAGRREGDVVVVRLEASVNEVGTLGIAAQAVNSSDRWTVAFDVRARPTGA